MVCIDLHSPLAYSSVHKQRGMHGMYVRTAHVQDLSGTNSSIWIKYQKKADHQRPKSQESKGPELHGGVASAHNNRTFPPHQHRQGFKAWRSLALLLFQNREIDTPRRPSGPLNLLRTSGTVPTKSIAQYGLHVMTLSSRVRPILPVLWFVTAAL